MADPTGGGDWFELYNLDSLPVALSGLYVTDDPSIAGRTKSQLAPLSFVGGHGWVQLEASGQTSQGRQHVNFSLNQSGDTLRLYTSNFTVIDSLALGLQEPGVAEGRLPDGSEAIVSFPTSATPNAGNYLPLDNVVINEVLAHTDAPLEDAIELHNPTASPVNLGGWYLSNSESDPKRYRLAFDTVILAGGYLVVYRKRVQSPAGRPPELCLEFRAWRPSVFVRCQYRRHVDRVSHVRGVWRVG